MGRRIAKSKRHKKLKFVDPCYTGPPVRPKNKRALPNEPPTEEDYQEVPNAMQQFMDEKSRGCQKIIKKKKKKKSKLTDDFIIVKKDHYERKQPGMTKPLKPLPDKVVQGRTESKRQFISRLQKMADSAIAEANLEQKYDIDIINIDKSGQAQFVSGQKQTGDKKREKRKKYRQKEREKKKRKLENKESDFSKDSVKFGEVVLEPPTLVKPRNVPETKPGKRKLMLTEMLSKKRSLDSDEKLPTQKKKVLSSSDKLMLEAERNRVVHLYRALKNKNKSL